MGTQVSQKWKLKWYLLPPKHAKNTVRLLTQYTYIALMQHKQHILQKDNIITSETEWNMLGQCHCDKEFAIGDVLIFPEALGVQGFYLICDSLYGSSKRAAYTYRLLYLGSNVWLRW